MVKDPRVNEKLRHFQFAKVPEVVFNGLGPGRHGWGYFQLSHGLTCYAVGVCLRVKFYVFFSAIVKYQEILDEKVI